MSERTISAARPFDLLVVGELNPDIIMRGEVTPAFGQVEQLVDEGVVTIGASSAIFACGTARLGLRVAFAGVVGADLFGRFMREELAARGVDVGAVVVDPALRTGFGVTLSRGADRAILTYAGSIGALRADHIDPALLRKARHLHLGGYYLLDALRPDVPALFAAAHSAGMSVSLDTNYDPSGAWGGGVRRALAHADLFLPNEHELLAITGQSDLAGALAAAARLVPTVAVKLGARGALACRGDELVAQPALPAELADTTGAGDSFDAGFVYGQLQGWDLGRALRLACACGSLSTRALGGTGAQPTLAEAEAAIAAGTFGGA